MTGKTLQLAEVMLNRDGFQVGPVSLLVSPGKLSWLSGRNGAGKSTLLAAIAGLLPVSGGRITLGERVLSGAGVHIPPWRRDVSLLLQDLGLWPHLTVRRQCDLVAGFASGAERRAQLAERLGITALLDRRSDRLSGGERQRCAFLRAVLPGKTVLLLDEPFSEQHPEGADRMREIIDEELQASRIVLVAGHGAPAGVSVLSLPG